MANVKISALPVAGTLDGTEIVPLVKGGITQRTTVSILVANAFPFNANFGANMAKAPTDDVSIGLVAFDETSYIAIEDAGIGIASLGGVVNIQSQGNLGLTGQIINITGDIATGEVNIVAKDVFFQSPGIAHVGGGDGNSTIECSVDGIQLSSLSMGFFGTFPITRPEVPAIGLVTVQDVVDALVALGLVTQAP